MIRLPFSATKPRYMPGFFLWWPILLLVLALAYWPGLWGGFYFDDMVHIVLNPFAHPARFDWISFSSAVNSSNSGPTGRPLAMLSFAFDYLWHGSNPAAMKAINVAIHAFNGFLLYRLLLRLLPPLWSGEPRKLAWLCAALWLLHPLQVSSVLYIVQRMTLLSATLMLLGLIGYVRERQKQRLATAWLYLALATAIGMLAKENALLTPVYAFLIEVGILRFAGLRKPSRDWIKKLYYALPWIFIFFALLYWAFHPDWFARTYASRPFDVITRLLTEARAVAFYQWLIVAPNVSRMGLYHDDFSLSLGIFTPPTTALAVLWHTFAIALAFVTRKKYPLVSFGIAWFYASHILESTIWPLELVFEHRNYLAILGIVLALIGSVDGLLSKLKNFDPQTRTRSLLLGFTLLLGVWTAITAVRSADWGDFFGHALMEAKRHPKSARSQFEAGQTLARGLLTHRNKVNPELLREARGYFLASAQLDQNDIAALVSLVSLEATIEKQVDDAIMTELIRRLHELKPKADTSMNLHALMLQVLDGEAGPLLEPWADAIFDAVLSNPAMTARERAEALMGGALYLNGHNGDDKEIVRLLYEASILVPQNLDYSIMLAAKLIDLGSLADARKVLDDIQQRDKYKVVETEVSRLKKRLAHEQ